MQPCYLKVSFIAQPETRWLPKFQHCKMFECLISKSKWKDFIDIVG